MSASTIGIIGAGQIGGTLTRLLDEAGFQTHLANSRGPASLDDVIAGLSRAKAATVESAIGEADLVIEAIPFGRVVGLPPAPLKGKILVSASNYYPSRDGSIDLQGLSQTEFVARKFPATTIVKAFNTIYWEHLRDQGDRSLPLDRRRAIPIAGDDGDALDAVAALVEKIGFGPLTIGSLAETKGLVEPGGELYNVDLTVAQAQKKVEETKG